MSTRPRHEEVHPLRRELEELRTAQTVAADDTVNEVVIAGELSGLNHQERSAARLGVNPEAFRPISFLNSAHYATLLKTNSLSGELAQRLEAFKAVSAG